jgi:filamentous hemagglutinin
MKKGMIAAVAVLAVGFAAYGADLTEVASFATPNLVAEINTMIGEADTRLDTLEALDFSLEDMAASNLTVGADLVVTGAITNSALTASQLVVTDANKALASSATVPADSVNKAAMSAVDYGDFTAGSDGTCSLDADVVAAAEMADADHGDVSWASGVATVDNVAAGNISGDIAVARIAEALKAPGAIGGTTPAAGTFSGLTVGKASVASGVVTLAGTTSGTATITVASDGSTVTVNKPVLAALNGTVGATTPAAGSFTDLGASGTTTLTPHCPAWLYCRPA